jgi:hypothetical protein
VMECEGCNPYTLKTKWVHSDSVSSEITTNMLFPRGLNIHLILSSLKPGMLFQTDR